MEEQLYIMACQISASFNPHIACNGHNLQAAHYRKFTHLITSSLSRILIIIQHWPTLIRQTKVVFGKI